MARICWPCRCRHVGPFAVGGRGSAIPPLPGFPTRGHPIIFIYDLGSLLSFLPVGACVCVRERRVGGER